MAPSVVSFQPKVSDSLSIIISELVVDDFSALSLELLEDLFFLLELLEDLELLFALLLELLESSDSSFKSSAELLESSPQEIKKNERKNERMAKFFTVSSYWHHYLLLNLLKY